MAQESRNRWHRFFTIGDSIYYSMSGNPDNFSHYPLADKRTELDVHCEQRVGHVLFIISDFLDQETPQDTGQTIELLKTTSQTADFVVSDMEVIKAICNNRFGNCSKTCQINNTIEKLKG